MTDIDLDRGYFEIGVFHPLHVNQDRKSVV